MYFFCNRPQYLILLQTPEEQFQSSRPLHRFTHGLARAHLLTMPSSLPHWGLVPAILWPSLTHSPLALLVRPPSARTQLSRKTSGSNMQAQCLCAAVGACHENVHEPLWVANQCTDDPTCPKLQTLSKRARQALSPARCCQLICKLYISRGIFIQRRLTHGGH